MNSAYKLRIFIHNLHMLCNLVRDSAGGIDTLEWFCCCHFIEIIVFLDFGMDDTIQTIDGNLFYF